MKKYCLALLLAGLLVLSVGCKPVDLAGLSGHVGASAEEAPVVYEDDNSGQDLDVTGPVPDEWN